LRVSGSVKTLNPTMLNGLLMLHLGALAAPFTFNWPAFWVFFGLFSVTVLGVTIGYHRLLTHRSFECPKAFEYFLTILGCLSSQGNPISWVSTHRYHHTKSDQEEDCHSPRHGFWHSHFLWFIRRSPVREDKNFFPRYAPDLVNDRFYQFLAKYGWTVQWIAGAILLAVGGWSFVVWGTFLRTIAMCHVTWAVNSASHRWGYRSFNTTDESRNLWWLALVNFGEGWHNNHHAFQKSAAHGLKWWEVDVTYMLIRFFSLFGLTYNIRVAVPSEARIKVYAEKLVGLTVSWTHSKQPSGKSSLRR
jgi:sn-1 stearoyl-lipid 9-desaturase